jgi:putative glutamine amidotransferase
MQTSSPIIGITPSPVRESSPAFGDVVYHRMTNTYTSAVEAGGGVPIVLPATHPAAAAQVIARLDGLLLSGGGDIRPSRYGDTGPQHAMTYGIDDPRDEWEMALLEAAFAADLPVLCICRGIQVLNVYRGGTLWQDVPSEMPGAESHKQPEGGPHLTAHTVRASGLLADVYGMSEVGTNSFHHQGIKDLGAGLVAVGQTADGLIEAVSYPDRSFVLGMQWHPEAMFDKRPEHEAPFRALTAAAIRRDALSVAD